MPAKKTQPKAQTTPVKGTASKARAKQPAQKVGAKQPAALPKAPTVKPTPSAKPKSKAVAAAPLKSAQAKPPKPAAKPAAPKPAAPKSAAKQVGASKANGAAKPKLEKNRKPEGHTDAPVAARAKALAREDTPLVVLEDPNLAAAGQKLPNFSLQDQAGVALEFQSLRGSPFVLYFYPKDDTPGCTQEACNFNDQLAEFAASGARVIGVSPDTQASHSRFYAKYGLKFTLLSDPEKTLSRALGVYKMKKNYGREYMGIERSTFLIDAEGVIRKAWRGVRVAGHVPQVLQALRSLESEA